MWKIGSDTGSLAIDKVTSNATLTGTADPNASVKFTVDGTAIAATATANTSGMEIRAPYDGKVVALTMFSVGGVIQRSEKIMDIVPDNDGLKIEAQLPVEKISEVHPGMRAEIHLTAFKQRIVPTLRGEVVQVSADRLTDPKTGVPFYVASIKLDPDDLAKLEGVRLHPGMSATVMLPTDSCTAFEYIVGPLASAFRHSFKQK